jgi:hypothetical protein
MPIDEFMYLFPDNDVGYGPDKFNPTLAKGNVSSFLPTPGLTSDASFYIFVQPFVQVFDLISSYVLSTPI